MEPSVEEPTLALVAARSADGGDLAPSPTSTRPAKDIVGLEADDDAADPDESIEDDDDAIPWGDAEDPDDIEWDPPEADDGPRQPTMGEIMGPDFVIDDAGLAEELAAQKRIRYATHVLDSLYGLTVTHEPSVMVEGEPTERLPTKARLLELVIDWLERARTLAGSPQTQIRRVP